MSRVSGCSPDLEEVDDDNESDDEEMQATGSECPGEHISVTSWNDDCAGSHVSNYLCVVDTALCFLLFNPAIVAFWRGIWELLDLYLLPENPYIGCWISLGVVSLFHFARVLLGPILQRLHRAIPNVCGKSLHMWTYTFVCGCMMLAHWRGLNDVFDYHIGEAMDPNLMGLAVATFILLITRTLSSSLGMPMMLTLDNTHQLLVYEPRFRTQSSRPLLHVLDHLYSLVICDTANILAWQAFANIWRLYMQTDEKLPVLLGVTGVGTGLLVAMCLLQIPVAYISSTLSQWHWLLSLLVEDIYYFLVLAGQMGYWIGVWGVMDRYFVLHQEPLSCVISSAVGFVVLASFRCSATVANTGVAVDVEGEAGTGVIWDTEYLEHMFQRHDCLSTAGQSEAETLVKQLRIRDYGATRTISRSYSINSDVVDSDIHAILTSHSINSDIGNTATRIISRSHSINSDVGETITHVISGSHSIDSDVVRI